MKNWAKVAFIFNAFVLMALTACSREQSEKNVQIQPGSFVTTLPSVVEHKPAKSKKCSLDTINGKPREKDNWIVNRNSSLTFSGWAFSMDGKETTPEVFIELAGPAQTYYALTTTRLMRPDANQYNQIDSSLAVGFELTATSSAIEPGVYEITVHQPLSKGTEFCDAGATLTVN